MMSAPIAICYLFREGDDKNKCLLFDQELVVVKDGREHHYPLDAGINFLFTHKRWMFPFVSGWIGGCIALLFIFRNVTDPWLSLVVLMISVFGIYIGWEGSEVLQIGDGKTTHSFPIRKVSINLRSFINFVKDYLIARNDDSRKLRIYHIVNSEDWYEYDQQAGYKLQSLQEEGFIHCSERKQVLGTYRRYFNNKEPLTLIEIDPLKLESELKLEGGQHNDGLFPHIYGVINKEAIVNARPFHSEEELQKLLEE